MRSGRIVSARRVGGDGVESDAARRRAPRRRRTAALRASCTNGAGARRAIAPSPAWSRVIDVASPGSHEPSAPGPASDAASPPTMRSSQASPASPPGARRARRSRSASRSSGEGSAARPTSSASAATAIVFMPTPPADSGTASAVQPSSTICFQSALVPRRPAARRSRRRTLWSRATSARSFSIGGVVLQELPRRVAQHLLVGAETEILGLSHRLGLLATSTSRGRGRARPGCCAGSRCCRPRS